MAEESRRMAEESRRTAEELRLAASQDRLAVEQDRRAALRTAEFQLSKAECRVQDLNAVLSSQSIDNIVRGLNDIMFDTGPSTGNRGDRVLDDQEVQYLKKNDLGYITRLVNWHSSESDDIHLLQLREKAYHCLTQDQRHLMSLFADKKVYNWQHRRHNILQHPIPSLEIVYTVVCALQEHGLLHDLKFKVLEDFLMTLPVTRRGEELFLSTGEEDVLERACKEVQYWAGEIVRLKDVLGLM